MQSISVEIAIADETPTTVTGYRVSAYWAITPCMKSSGKIDRKTWSLTHIPSGLCAPVYRSRKKVNELWRRIPQDVKHQIETQDETKICKIKGFTSLCLLYYRNQEHIDMIKPSHKKTVETLLKGIEHARPKLQQKLPDVAIVENALNGCISKSGSTIGKWKKTKPANNNDAARLWKWVKWHIGNGNLWGLPHDDIFENGVKDNTFETLATVILIITKQNHSAVDSWSKALGLGG